jgi:hypothetical protein
VDSLTLFPKHPAPSKNGDIIFEIFTARETPAVIRYIIYKEQERNHLYKPQTLRNKKRKTLSIQVDKRGKGNFILSCFILFAWSRAFFYESSFPTLESNQPGSKISMKNGSLNCCLAFCSIWWKERLKSQRMPKCSQHWRLKGQVNKKVEDLLENCVQDPYWA